jgi:hypothetical protein
MLLDKYPVIIGIPPDQWSEETRGLLVFASGRDDYAGRQRLTEADVVTEGIETPRNDHQVGHAEAPKSRPATRSRASTAAATNIAGFTYEDFETLLPDGNLAIPPCKTGAQDEVRANSMPCIQFLDNSLIREPSPVFPSKTRAKTHGRAARKLIVWSTDDEDDIEGELPKRDRKMQVDVAKRPGKVNTGKRKQRDDADGMASEHRLRRARTTTRVTDDDASMNNAFDQTSVPTSSGHHTFDGEGALTTHERALTVGIEMTDNPTSTGNGKKLGLGTGWTGQFGFGLGWVGRRLGIGGSEDERNISNPPW